MEELLLLLDDFRLKIGTGGCLLVLLFMLLLFASCRYGSDDDATVEYELPDNDDR